MGNPNAPPLSLGSALESTLTTKQSNDDDDDDDGRWAIGNGVKEVTHRGEKDQKTNLITCVFGTGDKLRPTGHEYDKFPEYQGH